MNPCDERELFSESDEEKHTELVRHCWNKLKLFSKIRQNPIIRDTSMLSGKDTDSILSREIHLNVFSFKGLLRKTKPS